MENQRITEDILEQSSNTIILAISDTEIGKVMLPSHLQFVDVATGELVNWLNDGPTFEKEVQALQYANQINDLMPRYIRTQSWKAQNGQEHDMLVMERLHPLPIHHFEKPTRAIMMQQFEIKMKELHDNGFVHGDLLRPTNFFTRNDQAWMFKNVVQTENGLRLIDAGFGMICNIENIKSFVKILLREQNEIEYFKEYYFL